MLLFPFPGFQTINTAQAVFLPVGASFSLLVMFFFFDTLQFFFALCTAGKWNKEGTPDFKWWEWLKVFWGLKLSIPGFF